MSNLTQDQIRKIAASLSSQGRYGDSQLVHVNKDEVKLLEKVGSGTTNPATGLREFYTEYANYKEAIDAEGVGATVKIAGQTGLKKAEMANGYTGSKPAANSSSSNGSGENSVRQNVANFFTPGDGMEYENGVLLNDDGSRVTENTSFQETTNSATPWDGKSYVNGQLVDDDTNAPVTSGHDSVFKTVSNVVGLVANPIAYVAGKAINSALDFDGDGSMFTKGGKFTLFDGDGSGPATTRKPITHGRANTRNVGDTSTVPGEIPVTGAPEEEITYSNISAAPTYRAPGFTSRPERRKFIEYDYTSGNGTPVGTYNGDAKPFYMATSQEGLDAYVVAETASNAIEQMISQMGPDVQDAMDGSVSVQLTDDNKLALYVGDDESGYIEATYSSDDTGMSAAMKDVANMLSYGEASGDTKFDAGYTGRVRSAKRFQGYDENTLNTQYARLISEEANLEVGTPMYLLWLERKQEIEDEIKRRDSSPDAHTSEYSVNGITRSVANSAREYFA